MAAKVFSVVFYVVAGFFIYMVNILGFAKMPSAAMKIGIMFGFSIPAVISLLAGLACDRFRHTSRDTGIVLLSSAGLTAFLVLTFACLLATEEFKQMMEPQTMAFLSDYPIGFGFLAIVSVIGLVALRAGIKNPNERSQ